MKLGKHLFKLFTAGCMFLSLAACSNAPAQNSTEESWDREVDFYSCRLWTCRRGSSLGS